MHNAADASGQTIAVYLLGLLSLTDSEEAAYETISDFMDGFLEVLEAGGYSLEVMKAPTTEKDTWLEEGEL